LRTVFEQMLRLPSREVSTHKGLNLRLKQTRIVDIACCFFCDFSLISSMYPDRSHCCVCLTSPSFGWQLGPLSSRDTADYSTVTLHFEAVQTCLHLVLRPRLHSRQVLSVSNSLSVPFRSCFPAVLRAVNKYLIGREYAQSDGLAALSTQLCLCCPWWYLGS